jgi:hypothetical protein
VGVRFFPTWINVLRTLNWTVLQESAAEPVISFFILVLVLLNGVLGEPLYYVLVLPVERPLI